MHVSVLEAKAQNVLDLTIKHFKGKQFYHSQPKLTGKCKIKNYKTINTQADNTRVRFPAGQTLRVLK